MTYLEVMQAAFQDELEKIGFAVTEKGHKYDAERHRMKARHSAEMDEHSQKWQGLGAHGSAPGGNTATVGGVLRFGPDETEGFGNHRHHEYVAKKHEAGGNAWNPLGGTLTPSSYERGGTALQLGKVHSKQE